jgi:hypothetical protein
MSYIVSTSILGIQTFVTRFDPSATRINLNFKPAPYQTSQRWGTYSLRLYQFQYHFILVCRLRAPRPTTIIMLSYDLPVTARPAHSSVSPSTTGALKHTCR